MVEVPNDIYFVGERIQELDARLSLVWNYDTHKHEVWYAGSMVMENPFRILDGRLVERLRMIDRQTRTDYDPARQIRERNEFVRRSYQNSANDNIHEAAKECARGIQHDIGVA